MKSLIAVLLAAALGAVPLAAAQAAEDVLIVYDASGSMWGQIDGVNKIVIARDVLADLVQGWPEDTHLGLVAYGHRSAGDCADIETLIKPQTVDRKAFVDAVNAINPKGKTPIAESLKHAAEVLKYRDNNATVVLISDGLESCHGDPCAVAAELEKSGVNFTAHVVGFDLDDAGNQALACIADNTGGIFVPASNASELKDALQQVQARVVQKEPAPQPEPEPEPQAEEPDYHVQISAPQQVTAGARFGVSWSESVNPRDFVQVVPQGYDEGKLTDYIRVENKTQGQLTAPAQPGLYEVRYVLNEGGKTLASTPVEVTDAEVTIQAPEQVLTGARFDVSWSQWINARDFVQIVPNGHDEGKLVNYFRVENKTEGRLAAPAQPGHYEVRYVLNEGGKTLASTPIEVVEAELAISAPPQVTVGKPFKVQWTISVASDDYYTIVPAGTDEGKTSDRALVGTVQEGTLRAPAEPGLYEVRYVLRQGMKTMASAPVEVVAGQVDISAPPTVRAGTPVKIRWTATIAADDYYTIVPAGTEEGKTGDRALVGKAQEGTLKAPAEPGLYEVRYVLRQGMRTMANAPVEVVAESAALDFGATLEAPATARTGETITVRWRGGSDSQEQRIALARADAADFTWIVAHKVGDEQAQEFTMPADPGRYEVRFLDVGNTEVLGRAIVEVK